MPDNRTELKLKIDEWFALHYDEMLDDLAELIAIKSVKSTAKDGAPYGVESRRALRLAASMLNKRGFAIETFDDMIITADLGPAPPKLGILAHLDVVAAEIGWNSDPFKMEIKDGKIFGRGAIDNKGPAVAAMYAMFCVRDIYPELQHGFRLLLGSGEECSCDDISIYLKKNKPPECVFTPDAEYPVVNIEKGRFTPFFGAKWEKDTTLPRIISITGGKTTNVVPNHSCATVEGFTIEESRDYCVKFSIKTGTEITATEDGGRVTITVLGRAAHAAEPHLGNNAGTALIEMLSAMPFAESKSFSTVKSLNRLFPHGDYSGSALGIKMSDEKTGELTVNFGVLRLSEYELEGNFDSRTPEVADSVDLLAITREALERERISVSHSDIAKCHHTPCELPFVQTLLDIYEEYTGNPRKCLAVGGQTYVHDIPNGVAFGMQMPGINNNVHSPNEFIDIEELFTGAKMFTMAILEICG